MRTFAFLVRHFSHACAVRNRGFPVPGVRGWKMPVSGSNEPANVKRWFCDDVGSELFWLYLKLTGEW